jgi:hypothetical protein
LEACQKNLEEAQCLNRRHTELEQKLKDEREAHSNELARVKKTLNDEHDEAIRRLCEEHATAIG